MTCWSPCVSLGVVAPSDSGVELIEPAESCGWDGEREVVSLIVCDG